MSARIIDGKTIAAELRAAIKAQTQRLADAHGIVPGLVGGPWDWQRWAPASPWATPPVAVMVLGWVALAAVAAISFVRKRRIGPVWLMAVGYAVACQIPIYLMRSSRFTALESRSFVASVSGLMRRDDIGEGATWREIMGNASPSLLANGGTCLAAPDGEWILPPTPPVGTLLVATIDNGFTLLRISEFWKIFFEGTAIVVAVTIDALFKQRVQAVLRRQRRAAAQSARAQARAAET